MKKEISFTSQGKRVHIGEVVVHRILPNRYIKAIGPFVFLDHVGPMERAWSDGLSQMGRSAHPHRGIATLSYILDGVGEHWDSRGHHAKVFSGGIQWMKAGNGVIHDETLNPDPNTGSPIIQGFQFWINLPPSEKRENPEYLAIAPEEVTRWPIGEESGWIKLISGSHDGYISRIPSFSDQFLIHIHLFIGARFSMESNKSFEYGAYLPQHSVRINEMDVEPKGFIRFEVGEGGIDLFNTSGTGVDVLLFGGEPITEPFITQGPFVMNSLDEVSMAYQDFYSGKYGDIDYGI